MEIIAQKTSQKIADNLGQLLMPLENVEKIDVYFHWQLIKNDPDDNKFVDCAISSKSTYIVTNDKHFDILNYVDFPPVNIITANAFLKKLS